MPSPRAVLAVLLAVALLAAVPAHAQAPAKHPAILAGRAAVIDGATIEVRGARIRLAGIANAADDHVCVRTGDGRWRCGPRAVNALDVLLQEAVVVCAPGTNNATAETLGALVATCTVGPVDLSLWLIRNGLALAAPPADGKYARAETEAKAARRGIWAAAAGTP